MSRTFIGSRPGLLPFLSLMLCLMAFGLPTADIAQVPGEPLTGQGRPELVAQIGHSGPVMTIAYSPDGSLIATGSWDTKVKLWDTKSGFLIRTLSGHTGLVKSLAFTPDGQALLTASYDDTLKLWNVATGQVIWSVSASDTSVALSHDGRLLATGSELNIRLRDPRTGQVRLTLPGLRYDVHCLAISPDGTRLASGGETGDGQEGELRLWDPQSGQALQTLASDGSVTTVAFSPDGRTLASGGRDKAVHLWNVPTGALLRTLEAGKISDVNSLAFSPDGKLLAVAGLDAAVRLYDPRTGQSVRELQEAASAERVVCFSPDGQTLACGGDGTFLCDTGTGAVRKKLIGGSMKIAALAFSPDGQTLVTGNWDNTVRVWDVPKRQLRATLSKQPGWVEAVAYAPNGRTFASGGAQVPLRLWNSPLGTLQQTLAPDSAVLPAPAPGGPRLGWVKSLAYAPNGSFLVSADLYQGANLWDPAAGQALRHLDADRYGVTAVAVSPDSSWVAGVGEGKALHMWDARTGAALWTSAGKSAEATQVLFSPDGKTVATAGWHGKLWDARTGDLRQTLDGSFDRLCLAYSPDGRLLVSGGKDGLVQVWDARTGKRLRSLDSGHGWVWAVAFAPDGKTLAAGCDNATVDLWDVTPGAKQRESETPSELEKSEEGAQWAEAATLAICPPIKEGETSQVWLAFTPQMYYDCSAGADPYLWWRYDGLYYPASSFEKMYHRPDLLQTRH